MTFTDHFFIIYMLRYMLICLFIFSIYSPSTRRFYVDHLSLRFCFSSSFSYVYFDSFRVDILQQKQKHLSDSILLNEDPISDGECAHCAYSTMNMCALCVHVIAVRRCGSQFIYVSLYIPYEWMNENEMDRQKHDGTPNFGWMKFVWKQFQKWTPNDLRHSFFLFSLLILFFFFD